MGILELLEKYAAEKKACEDPYQWTSPSGKPSCAERASMLATEIADAAPKALHGFRALKEAVNRLVNNQECFGDEPADECLCPYCELVAVLYEITR